MKNIAKAFVLVLILTSTAFADAPAGDGGAAAATPAQSMKLTPEAWKQLCARHTVQATAEAKVALNGELQTREKRIKDLEKERDAAKAEAKRESAARAQAKATVRVQVVRPPSRPRVARPRPRPAPPAAQPTGSNTRARLKSIEERLNDEKSGLAALATAIAEVSAKFPGNNPFVKELNRLTSLEERVDRNRQDVQRELDKLNGRVDALDRKVEEVARRKLGSMLTFGPAVGMTLLADKETRYSTSLLGARLRFLITDRVSVVAEGGAAVSITGTGTFGNVLVSYAFIRWLAVEAGPSGVWSDLSGRFLTRRMYLLGSIGVTFRPLETRRGSLTISLRGNVGISRDDEATRLAGGYQAFLGWEF